MTRVNGEQLPESFFQQHPEMLEQLAPETEAPSDPRLMSPQWPEPMEPAARRGLAGEIVDALEPFSEADPAAHLAQLLVAFGNAVGRTAFYRVEEDLHFSNQFMVLVGPTSKGRKGVSWTPIRRLLEAADPSWGRRIMPGLSSGEGLVHQVRDPRGEGEDADPGEDDKRLMVCEPEFASALAVMARQGNTLSAILRQAWDGGRLANMTKKTSESCEEPHISIVGHVTAEELRRCLDRTELANGFANRFLFICARRSKLLPDGESVPDQLRQQYTQRLREAINFARGVERMQRDGAARELWHQVYGPLSEGQAGLFGAVTGRAEAHVLRLSCLYALLDSKSTVGPEHLQAALAFWNYAQKSAFYVFGEATGDPVADSIMEALQANPDGLTRTQIRDMFNRHQSKSRIDGALNALRAQGKAQCIKQSTEGRSTEIWLVSLRPKRH